MKHILTIAVALALPLSAEEAKPQQQQPQQPPAAATATADAPSPQDSPLVAAAKRAKLSRRKPTPVITNEMVKQSGGEARVTTTARQTPLPKVTEPLRPTPEMEHARAREKQKREAAAQEAAAKKAEHERQRRLAAAAAADEEGLYAADEGDPAQNEKTLQDASQQKPPG